MCVNISKRALKKAQQKVLMRMAECGMFQSTSGRVEKRQSLYHNADSWNDDVEKGRGFKRASIAFGNQTSFQSLIWSIGRKKICESVW